MTASELAEKLHARRSGRGWIARCPSHKDRSPSLSIAAGEAGRVLLKCFAGCETSAVLAALGLRWADILPPRQKLSPAEMHRQRFAREQAESAAWKIRDRIGELRRDFMDCLHGIERRQAELVAELHAAKTDVDREPVLDRLAQLAPQSTEALERFNFAFDSDAKTLAQFAGASPAEQRVMIFGAENA